MIKDVFTTEFAKTIFKDKYSLDKKETWADCCKRVTSSVCGQLIDPETQEDIYNIMLQRLFIPGGRYLANAGRPFHQCCNCFMFKAEDSRESWSDIMHKITMTLMSGGGIGVIYNNLRGSGSIIKRTGGISSGPLALMHMVNEAGRYIIQGGNRRSAIWAGLNWDHPDISSFLVLKNYTEAQKIMKEQDHTFPLPMEGTNISVIYDTEFFIAINNPNHPKYNLANDVWYKNSLQAFSTGEPGFSFNFLKDNENLRNACTEVVSEDDSDVCNLGTVWINRIKDKEELKHVVKLSTLFLLCGSIYTNLPLEKSKEVQSKNNRIGLGIGGIHEWLLTRGYDYEVPQELHKWLRIYERESNESAYIGAKQLGVTIPKGKRAIAPNGTIGIIAESTTGIEPLFCKSYKRRYFKEGTWQYQYVVDGSVKRLLDLGIKLEQIKDSFDIPFKQRIKFQADVQSYVDMSISSTCNMPAWGTENNNKDTLNGYVSTLLKYAKRLRGFTIYPDGCRSGQPLERCGLEEALANEGRIFEDKEDRCIGGVCGV